jgi:hypothetical protein
MAAGEGVEVIDVTHYRNQNYGYAFVKTIVEADKFKTLKKYSAIDGKDISISRRWFRHLKHPREIAILGFKQTEITVVKKLFESVGPIKEWEVVSTGSRRKAIFAVFEKGEHALEAMQQQKTYSIKRASISKTVILQVMWAMVFNTTGGKKEKDESNNKNALVAAATQNELVALKQIVAKSQEALTKELAKMELQNRIAQKETLTKAVSMIKAVVKQVSEAMNNAMSRMMRHTAKGMALNARVAAAQQRVDNLDLKIIVFSLSSKDQLLSMIPDLNKSLAEAQLELKRVLDDMDDWNKKNDEEAAYGFNVSFDPLLEDNAGEEDKENKEEDDDFLNESVISGNGRASPIRNDFANITINVDELGQDKLEEIASLACSTIEEMMDNVLSRQDKKPVLKIANRKAVLELAKEIGTFIINFQGTASQFKGEQYAQDLMQATSNILVLHHSVVDTIKDPSIFYEMYSNDVMDTTPGNTINTSVLEEETNDGNVEHNSRSTDEGESSSSKGTASNCGSDNVQTAGGGVAPMAIDDDTIIEIKDADEDAAVSLSKIATNTTARESTTNVVTGTINKVMGIFTNGLRSSNKRQIVTTEINKHADSSTEEDVELLESPTKKTRAAKKKGNTHPEANKNKSNKSSPEKRGKKCGKCGGMGHNKRNCGLSDDEAETAPNDR